MKWSGFSGKFWNLLPLPNRDTKIIGICAIPDFCDRINFDVRIQVDSRILRDFDPPIQINGLLLS
jgi:hypothetical protein